MELSHNMIQVLNFAIAKHHGQKYGDKDYFHHLDNVYQTYCYLFGEPLMCECGNHIGGMHLDCYEDKNVSLIKDKVVRVYR